MRSDADVNFYTLTMAKAVEPVEFRFSLCSLPVDVLPSSRLFMRGYDGKPCSFSKQEEKQYENLKN